MDSYVSLIDEIKSVIKSKKIREVGLILDLMEDMLRVYEMIFDKFGEKEKRYSCDKVSSEFLPFCENLMANVHFVSDDFNLERLFGLYQKGYAFSGRRNLSRFIEYMEWDRTSHNKVFENRRDVLFPFVYYLNEMKFSDNLEYVFASYAPNYGKSFTLNYYSAWSYGIDYNASILRISYSEDLVNSCSRSIKDLISSSRFSDVFPNFKRLNGKCFDKEKESDWRLKGADILTSHYARTRDGQITGTKANDSILIDDITKGAEEATNASLHQRLYNQWNTEWGNRKDGDRTKYVFAGTMWSPEDILNRVREDTEFRSPLIPSDKFPYCWVSEDGKTVVIRVPLLDDNDETTCSHVMTTEKALFLRATTDEYFFSCVFQQDPIAPSGLEFSYDNLRKFRSLDGIELSSYCYAVLDPARKGKDNVSMPICRASANFDDHYMIDVLFKQKAMSELYDEIVDKIIHNKVVKLIIENNIDTSLKFVIENKLKERNYDCEIIEKYATLKKERRIVDSRGYILRHILFLEMNLYGKNTDYGRFMANLTKYSFDYANKHDDAPDSLSLYITEIFLGGAKINKAKAINRGRLGF